MANRRTIFCDISFWKKFIASKPDMEDLNDRNIRQLHCWLNFLQFLSKSDIHFNIDIDEYNAIKASDLLLAKLWKKSAGGECGIEFTKEDFPYIDNLSIDKIDDNFLNSVCLIDQEDLCCTQKYASFGILAMNPKIALNSSHLFNDNGIAVPHEYEKDWSFLDRITKKAPFLNVGNSIIIADNYIFQNWDRACNGNIIPILERLLPYNLIEGLTYDISIYTMVDGNAELGYILKDKIKVLRPDLSFNLNVYNVATKKTRPDGTYYCYSKYFHDRCIVTNYVWIGSGHGFDVFPHNDNEKSTTINVIFPYFQQSINWVDNAFENLIKDAKKVNSKYLTHTIDYWGDKKRESHLLKEHIIHNEIKLEFTDEKRTFDDDFCNVPKLAGPKILGNIDLSLLNKYANRSRVR